MNIFRGVKLDRARMAQSKPKSGFTVIEVMLFLAITGVMLIGVLGGTYSSISNQRYNDSVRDFAEFLRQVYGEVISPQTIGGGNSDSYAIYGKAIVFGLDNDSPTSDADHNVYTATIVGSPTIPTSSGTFMNELKAVSVQLFCGLPSTEYESTLNQYTPNWDTKINSSTGNPFKGTIIIARSPTSGTVHTAYSETAFSINTQCQPDDRTASTTFQTAIQNNPESFSTSSNIDFCLKSSGNRIVRDIRLTADGHNSSAVNILGTDDSGAVCH